MQRLNVSNMYNSFIFEKIYDLVQLNGYETDGYFLQNFKSKTMLIYVFCKIREGEIVFYYKCQNKNNFRFATLTKQANAK